MAQLNTNHPMLLRAFKRKRAELWDIYGGGEGDDGEGKYVYGVNQDWLQVHRVLGLVYVYSYIFAKFLHLSIFFFAPWLVSYESSLAC